MFSKSVLLAFTITSMLLVGSKGDAIADEQDGKYSDAKYDFTVTVSKPWKSAQLKDYTVPGVSRAAYSRASGASIVFFVQEPGKDFEPRFLVDESAKSMEKSLKATVHEKEVVTVAEKKAMWLVVEGGGTGGAIDGKGSVKTSQHWVAIPREKDIVVALLTSPTSEFAENRKSFAEAIKTLVVGGKQTAAQSESK